MEGSGSYSYLSFMTSKVGFWTSMGSDGSEIPTVRISSPYLEILPRDTAL